MTTGLSDAQEIDNLLTDTTLDSVKFNDAQWGFITDINNGSYQDRVTISTTVLKQQLIDYHSAFLTIPMTVTRAGLPLANAGSQLPTGSVNNVVTSPYDYVNTQVNSAMDPSQQGSYLKGNTHNEPLLCFRDSVLNLICGLIVQTDNGQAIVNELGYLDFINNLRLKIENSIDWSQTMSSLLHFSMDTVATSYFNSGFPQFDGSRPWLTSNANVNPFLPDANAASGHYSTWPAGVTYETAPTSSAIPNGYVPTPTLSYSTGTIALVGSTGAVTGTGTVFTPAMAVNATLFVGGQSAPVTGQTTATALTVPAGLLNDVAAGASYVIVYDAVDGANQSFPTAVPNPGFNKGVWDRVQIFQNASSYVRNNNTSSLSSYNLIVKIPLRLLHDFFEQLDFPIINVGFNMQFIFRQSHNPNPPSAQPLAPSFYNNCPPMMGATMYGPNGTSTYATWGAGLSAIQYGSTTVGSANNQTYGTGVRLYYRSLKLNPADNEAFKTKLTRGFTKKIKFISTDTYSPPQLISGGSTGNSSVIAPSIVWPLRVWALLYSANGAISKNSNQGALGGNYSSFVSGQPAQLTGNASSVNTIASGMAPMNGLQVVHGWMKNANILVNNQQYFKNSLQTPDDFWLQFKEQLNRNTGCMITYQDFIKLFRYHCFDLSRLSDRLPSKTEAVSLQLVYDRADTQGGVCDLIVLIERLNQVQMDFAASDVTITVGNITS